MANREYVERLQLVISHLHGCDSEHLRTVPVKETVEGDTVWEGNIEVFRVKHAVADKCYAWSYKSDGQTERFAAVLGRDPMNTPRDAVRAVIVANTSRASL